MRSRETDKIMSLVTIARLEYGNKFTLGLAVFPKIFLFIQRPNLSKSIRMFEEHFSTIEFGPCFMLKRSHWFDIYPFQLSLWRTESISNWARNYFERHYEFILRFFIIRLIKLKHCTVIGALEIPGEIFP